MTIKYVVMETVSSLGTLQKFGSLLDPESAEKFGSKFLEG